MNAAMIKRLRGKKYNVTRMASGSYSATTGLFVPGSTTVIPILGSVQPLTYEDIISIPEGDRTTERYRFYSFAPVQTNQAPSLAHGDVISVSGIDYKVEKVAHWPNHSKAIIARVNSATN